VPMCLLAAIAGVWLTGLDNTIFTQIGLVVLVGLAAKNAILIVEFAKQRQDAGATPAEAVLEAAKLRLRPIMMTSLTFILGTLPLVLGTGAGAEMRPPPSRVTRWGLSPFDIVWRDAVRGAAFSSGRSVLWRPCLGAGARPGRRRYRRLGERLRPAARDQ